MKKLLAIVCERARSDVGAPCRTIDAHAVRGMEDRLVI
jgi:hypothetical protein